MTAIQVLFAVIVAFVFGFYAGAGWYSARLREAIEECEIMAECCARVRDISIRMLVHTRGGTPEEAEAMIQRAFDHGLTDD